MDAAHKFPSKSLERVRRWEKQTQQEQSANQFARLVY